MYIKYIADDGTEFNTEEECESYEWDTKINALEHPFMWDADGEPTTNLERVIYLKIENEEQAQAFFLRSNRESLVYPHDLFTEDEEGNKHWNTGSWHYDTYIDEYVNIRETVTKLENEVKQLKKYL